MDENNQSDNQDTQPPFYEQQFLGDQESSEAGQSQGYIIPIIRPFINEYNQLVRIQQELQYDFQNYYNRLINCVKTNEQKAELIRKKLELIKKYQQDLQIETDDLQMTID